MTDSLTVSLTSLHPEPYSINRGFTCRKIVATESDDPVNPAVDIHQEAGSRAGAGPGFLG